MSKLPKVLLSFSVAILIGLEIQPTKADSFTSYDTGASSELISSLPITNVKYVLYSQEITLSANDILVVYSQGELANTTATPANLEAQLIVGCSASATTGTALGQANGFKVTTDMYYGVRVKTSILPFPSGSPCAGNTFVNVVVWANQDINGGSLTVEQGYGSLQILKISP